MLAANVSSYCTVANKWKLSKENFVFAQWLSYSFCYILKLAIFSEYKFKIEIKAIGKSNFDMTTAMSVQFNLIFYILEEKLLLDLRTLDVRNVYNLQLILK